MAYPDDKSMTKIGGNLHVPVTSKNYTSATDVLTEQKRSHRPPGREIQLRIKVEKHKEGDFLMMVVRIIRGIAGVAGLGALTLGLLYWIAQMNFISMHMLFGLIVALSLLILGIVAVFTRGMRLLGAIGIVYALIVPAFGLTQAALFVGSLHWLIQTAHLLVGLGALAFIGVISTRYLRLKRLATKAPAPQTVR
jgi:hypothetical protein